MFNKIFFYFCLSLIFMLSFASAAQVCDLYDDFSSGFLNSSKWEIRQDIEGQPFMDEYGLAFENGSYVFHMQQNTIADRRVYLVPNLTFTTGDKMTYDYNVISKEGNYGSMVLLTGDQYIRVGISGYNNGIQGYDELGISHIKIEFQENNFHLERISPSNITLIDNLALTNTNGNYVLYIGGFSGHNGRVHIDFDDFVICSEVVEPPTPSVEERLSALESRVAELENRTSVLEEENTELREQVSLLDLLIDKIVDFINGLPQGLNRNWAD